MKILHVPYTFHPDSVGGTEIYVEGLTLALQGQGVESAVAAPGAAARYRYRGIPVHRFPVTEEISRLEQLYGEGDEGAAGAFEEILETERPHLVHLHALTRGCSTRLVSRARRRGLPVVLTYHTPTVSCLRGTLLKWGSEICDGLLREKDCAACTLHGKGLDVRLSRLVAACPPALTGSLAAVLGRRRLATLLRMRELTALRHRVVRSLFEEVSVIVALAGWSRDLLRRNRVPQRKIVLCRHGLVETSRRQAPVRFEPKERLRLAFLGRLSQEKGLDLMIRAVRRLQAEPVELHIFGITDSLDARQRWLGLAEGDERIIFRDPVPNQEVISLLGGFHFLTVPSRWLETGPLVVLEAFAAGIPVLGGALGGIAELVTHEIDGLLIENDIEGWVEAIRRCIREPRLHAALQKGIRPPRRMEQVASEMKTLYGKVLSGRCSGPLTEEFGELASA